MRLCLQAGGFPKFAALRTLIAAELIDEYRIWVFPLVLGAKMLFENGRQGPLRRHGAAGKIGRGVRSERGRRRHDLARRPDRAFGKYLREARRRPAPTAPSPPHCPVT